MYAASRGAGSIEKYLERKLCEWVRDIGGEAIKGPSYDYKGIPDRIIILPDGGGTVWVEVKGNTYYGLQPKQVWWKEKIINSSPGRYFLIDTKEDLQRVMEECQRFIDIAKANML